MSERITMFEHPEYQHVPELLKNSPAFNFSLYLKNKGRTQEERDQTFEKNMADFDAWLTEVSTTK